MKKMTLEEFAVKKNLLLFLFIMLAAVLFILPTSAAKENKPIRFAVIDESGKETSEDFAGIDDFLAVWSEEYAASKIGEGDTAALLILPAAGDTTLDFGELEFPYPVYVNANTHVVGGHFAALHFVRGDSVFSGGTADTVSTQRTSATLTVTGGGFGSLLHISQYAHDGLIPIVHEDGYFHLSDPTTARLMYRHLNNAYYFTSFKALEAFDYPSDVTVTILRDVAPVYCSGRNFTLDLENKDVSGDITVYGGQLTVINAANVNGRVIERGGSLKLGPGWYAYIEDSGASVDDLLHDTAAFPGDEDGWYKNSMGNVRSLSNVRLVKAPFTTFYIDAYEDDPNWKVGDKLVKLRNNVAAKGQLIQIVPGLVRYGMPAGADITYTISTGTSFTKIQLDEGMHTITVTASYRGFSRSASVTVAVGDAVPAFTDVRAGDWFFDAVQGVVRKGLFRGVSATEFAPDDPMSRAMILTVLMRIDPMARQINGSSAFADVSVAHWYSQAAKWAVSTSHIASPYDVFYEKECLDGDRPASREELAVYMYRMANYLGLDTSIADGKIDRSDADQVSDWAREAVSYMIASGLMVGNPDGTFDPKGDTSRAAIATVIGRFYNMIG